MTHRGRSSWEGVSEAMERLFELGGVRPERRHVVVGGARLHYVEAGSGDPPVLLLQGAGGGAANWYRVLGPLSERRRVLALDLPGFGLSEPIRPEPPLGATGAGLIRSWFEALGVGNADVVGTSFGGLLALRLAQAWPEHVGRLVLLDSVGLGRSLPWLVRVASLPGVGRAALHPTRAGTRRLFRLLLTTDRSGLEGHEDALVEYLYRSAAASDPGALARALRLFCGLGGQREVLTERELARLESPVLVVWGERDRFLPVSHGQRAAASIPGARLCIVPGAGHSPNWEAPAGFLAAVLPFLGEAERGVDSRTG